jgi:hypothetical protein
LSKQAHELILRVVTQRTRLVQTQSRA